MIATCANESRGGLYVHQVKGPALGIYQMESVTHDDIWERFIEHRANLKASLMGTCNFKALPDAIDMIWNLQYATLMARIFYLRFPQALPEAGDIDAIWALYKEKYNTRLGSATKDTFMRNYQEFVKA